MIYCQPDRSWRVKVSLNVIPSSNPVLGERGQCGNLCKPPPHPRHPWIHTETRSLPLIRYLGGGRDAYPVGPFIKLCKHSWLMATLRNACNCIVFFFLISNVVVTKTPLKIISPIICKYLNMLNISICSKHPT